MKKLFYLVALVAAVTLTACGGKKETPRAIQKIIEMGKAELVGQNIEGMSFTDIFAEGEDIVMVAELNENYLPEGMTLKQVLELSGQDEATLGQMMVSNMEQEDYGYQAIGLFRYYKYNFVFRMVGSNSGEQINCRVNWTDLPEIDLTEEEIKILEAYENGEIGDDFDFDDFDEPAFEYEEEDEEVKELVY
jgi:hypothetical protein